MKKYDRQREIIKHQNVTDSIRKAKFTRLNKSINDQLSQVESRYGAIANGAENIILSSKLKEMYEAYTNRKFDINDVMTRRDLTEFYIDIDERKRMWVSFSSQYKYKCTLDNKCMGKGTRYQLTPLITFEDYEGPQVN